MTGSLPDYAFLLVGANMGVTKMTKVRFLDALLLYSLSGAHWFGIGFEDPHHRGDHQG